MFDNCAIIEKNFDVNSNGFISPIVPSVIGLLSNVYSSESGKKLVDKVIARLPQKVDNILDRSISPTLYQIHRVDSITDLSEIPILNADSDLSYLSLDTLPFFRICFPCEKHMTLVTEPDGYLIRYLNGMDSLKEKLNYIRNINIINITVFDWGIYKFKPEYYYYISDKNISDENLTQLRFVISSNYASVTNSTVFKIRNIPVKRERVNDFVENLTYEDEYGNVLSSEGQVVINSTIYTCEALSYRYAFFLRFTIADKDSSTVLEEIFVPYLKQTLPIAFASNFGIGQFPKFFEKYASKYLQKHKRICNKFIVDICKEAIDNN
jgi:hypothetical protein